MTKTEQLIALYREVQITGALITQAVHDANGIPPAQFHILAHLVNTTNSEESPSDLACVFRVSKPAMTQLIQRLRKKGWVSLAPVPGDERRKQVLLSSSGRAMYKKSLELVQPKTEYLAGLMTKAELAQLSKQMHKLRIAVEKETAK